MKTGIAKHYSTIDYSDESHPLPSTPIDPAHAMRCARRLHRWALGEFPANGEALTTGNRYTWRYRGVLTVNAGRGWKRLAHDLSHLFWRLANPGERPHSKAHARFEAKLIREIIRRGYHLEPAATPMLEVVEPVDKAAAKVSARAERIARLQAREERWQRKADRAAHALAKIRRSLRAYARADAKAAQ